MPNNVDQQKLQYLVKLARQIEGLNSRERTNCAIDFLDRYYNDIADGYYENTIILGSMISYAKGVIADYKRDFPGLFS